MGTPSAGSLCKDNGQRRGLFLLSLLVLTLLAHPFLPRAGAYTCGRPAETPGLMGKEEILDFLTLLSQLAVVRLDRL